MAAEAQKKRGSSNNEYRESPGFNNNPIDQSVQKIGNMTDRKMDQSSSGFFGNNSEKNNNDQSFQEENMSFNSRGNDRNDGMKKSVNSKSSSQLNLDPISIYDPKYTEMKKVENLKALLNLDNQFFILNLCLGVKDKKQQRQFSK